MLIGKIKKQILIIIGFIIIAFIVYRIYQKNRTIEVYQVYPLRYAVKNFHFGKNQFKQLDTIAKKILLELLAKRSFDANSSWTYLIFIVYNREYFKPNMTYKDSSYYPTGFIDIPPDWYSYPDNNQIAIYEWNLETGKNIKKEYYKEGWFFNQVFLSNTDPILNIDKSLLPYYKNK